MCELRIFDLDRQYHLKKCGPEIIASSVLGATGIFGSFLGAASADSAMMMNSEEAEKNRQFNSEEAEKARSWQSDQWNHQFSEATKEWYNQFAQQNSQWLNQQTFLANQWRKQQDYANQQSYDYWLKQQQYNSPQQMVTRLNSAGLNAAAAINAQQFGSTGLSAAPVGVQTAPVSSPSVPSVATPSSSAAAIGQNNLAATTTAADSVSHIVSSIGGLIKNLAGARKDNIEARRAEDSLSTFLADQIANLNNVELKNKFQEMHNVFFDKSAPKALQKLGKEVDLLAANIMFTNAQEDFVSNQSITEGFKQLLLGVQKDLTGQQLSQAIIVTGQLKDQLIAYTDSLRAKASNDYAQSFKARAEGATENQLRELRVSIASVNKEIAEAQREGIRLDNLFKDKTVQDKIKIVTEQALQAGIITQQEMTKLNQFNDVYSRRNFIYFFDWLSKGAGAVRDFGIGASTFGTGFKSTPVDSPWTLYGGSEGTSTFGY